MSDDQSREHELSTAEREALRRLYGDAALPPGLEDSTVAALRARGRLGLSAARRPHAVRQAAMQLAAAVALFAAGVLVGRAGSRTPFPAAPNDGVGRRAVQSDTLTRPRPAPKVQLVVWF